MLYLVCREDQIPSTFDANTPIDFRPSLTYYPRIVFAQSPEGAVERAFYPDQYRPSGERKLVVIELGTIYQLTATPVPPPPPLPNYTLSKSKRVNKLLRPF